MGKSVSFFMDRDDEREFSTFVQSDESVVFIPQASDTFTLPEFRSPHEADRLTHKNALLIWNKRICEKLVVKQFAPNVFAADVGNNTPLIGFRRSSLHGTIRVAGELSAEMYALDSASSQLVHKGREFEQWYNRLSRWIRRHYARDPKYGICMGSGVRRAFELGQIQLAQHMTPNGPI